MTFSKDIPGVLTAQVATNAHAAATTTEYIAAWEAPDNIKVISISWRVGGAITGNDTNTTNINLDNGGTAGTGTTELGNQDFPTSTDAAQGQEFELYAPASPVAYDEGNLFLLQAEKVGSGVAVPSGVMIVKYTNNG